MNINTFMSGLFCAAIAVMATDACAVETGRSALDLDLYKEFANQPSAATSEATSTLPPIAEGAPASRAAAVSDDRERRFGRAGSRWWSVGSGLASDFSEGADVNIHGIFSQFIADELEFGVEAAGWYFNQQGKDTGGLSGSMIFRWHFAHDEEFTWSVFGDLGIGLLGSFDEVPDGGTGFNFLPRAGVGFTHLLDSTEVDGCRLTLGVRWHHISNARIEGEERNPARDGLMFYAEVQFPF